MSDEKPSRPKTSQNPPGQAPTRIVVQPAGSAPGTKTILNAKMPPGKRKTGE